MSEELKACPLCHAPPRLHTNPRGHRYAVCEGVGSGHSLLSMQADDWNDSLRTPPAANPRGGSEDDIAELEELRTAWRSAKQRGLRTLTFGLLGAPTPAPAADDGRALREALALQVAGIANTITCFPGDAAWGGADQARHVAAILSEASAALHATAAAGVD